MKGQISLEFLIAISISLAVVFILASGLVVQIRGARSKASEIERINIVESSARALESSLNNGGFDFDFYNENVYYSVENNRFHCVYSGHIIEVGGVFTNDPDEPI